MNVGNFQNIVKPIFGWDQRNQLLVVGEGEVKK